MKIRTVLFIVLLAVALACISCTPTPAAPVKETVPVPQTVVVQQTVAVPQTVTVAQTVVVPQTVVVQVTPVPQPTKPPEQVKAVDVSKITAAWKTSTHATDYGLGRGPNTYCARCHSPRNWDPKAIAGPAPNCMACKFPFDKEVRKPPPNTNVFIEEKDWKAIGCDTCHQVTTNVVDAKPAMWNQATGKYDVVSDNTALCEKCHTDSLGGSNHKIAIGGPAHTGQIGLIAPRPQQCTDCHDPHSQQAVCTDCHKNLSKAAGHDAAHAKVTCTACHDAAGMKAQPNETGVWVTFAMVASRSGPPTLSEVTSHKLQKSVDCTRCHYDNNQQKLRSMVTPTATRAPASPTSAAAPATPTAAK